VQVQVDRQIDMAQGRYITIIPNATSCHDPTQGTHTIYSTAPVSAPPNGLPTGGAQGASSTNTYTDATSDAAVTGKVNVTSYGGGTYTVNGKQVTVANGTTAVDASSINPAFSIVQGTSYANLTKTIAVDPTIERNQALANAGALQFAGLLADPTTSLQVMDVTNQFVTAGGSVYSQVDNTNNKTDAKDAVTNPGIVPVVNVDKSLQPTVTPANNGYITNQVGFLPVDGGTTPPTPSSSLIPPGNATAGGNASGLVPNPALLTAGTQINKYYTNTADPTSPNGFVGDTTVVSNQSVLWYTANSPSSAAITPTNKPLPVATVPRTTTTDPLAP